MRRLLDIIVAIAGLLILAPLLIVIAACLLVLQGAPVFYRQYRAGLGGRTFSIIKFRTMYPGAEQVSSFDVDTSARITPIGGLLKASRLDELPQLINLLSGAVTLVGPRPLPLLHTTHLDADTLASLWQVKPGITDPVALEFVAEDQVLSTVNSPEAAYLKYLLPEKARRQVEYLKCRSAWDDTLVVLQTPRLLWSRRCRQASAERVRHLLAGQHS